MPGNLLSIFLRVIHLFFATALYNRYLLYIFFNLFLFIYDRHRERDREAETQAEEREKQAPYWEPDVGLDPGTPGSRPGSKAGAKLLSHPGIPYNEILSEFYYPCCHCASSFHFLNKESAYSSLFPTSCGFYH